MTTQPDVTLEVALNGSAARLWLLSYTDRLQTATAELTELDRAAGDGDFGWNVATAARRAEPQLQSTPAAPPAAFGSVSDAFLAAGGTSGPLFGLWFGRLAAGPYRDWSTADLASAVEDATDAVRRLGGANPGDRTMVDALVPAQAALHACGDVPWHVAAGSAAAAAQGGAEATKSMLPRRGRATYLGERALGVIDPGALAVAWFFAAASQEPNA